MSGNLRRAKSDAVGGGFGALAGAMGTGVVGRIARGYLSLLRVAGFLVAVVLGAAAAGAAITAPLWLFATRATPAYNWFIVIAVAGVLCTAAAARLVRGARRAPSVGRYLCRAAAAGARIAGRAAAVAALALLELMVFTRWGTLPGLLALPLLLVLVGILLFARPARSRNRTEG